jgi:hypothetical protein
VILLARADGAGGFAMRPGANRSLRKLKTYRGRVIDDIGRRIVGNEDLQEAFVRPQFLARRGAGAPPARPQCLFPARASDRVHR